MSHRHGSLRHTLQTFNHSIWAAKNAARLVKGSVSTVRKASRGIRNLKRRLVNGPKSDVVARVKQKTRSGIADKYFAKHTPAGHKRRMELAAKLKSQHTAKVAATKPKITRTPRSSYVGKIELKRGMTTRQLKKNVSRYKMRDMISEHLRTNNGDRIAAARQIKGLRKTGNLRPGTFTTTAYNPLYKKALKNYAKAFGKK